MPIVANRTSFSVDAVPHPVGGFSSAPSGRVAPATAAPETRFRKSRRVRSFSGITSENIARPRLPGVARELESFVSPARDSSDHLLDGPTQARDAGRRAVRTVAVRTGAVHDEQRV